MRKCYFFRVTLYFLLFLFSSSIFADSGLFQTYVIIDSGSGNQFFAGGINSDGAQVFANANLGTYCFGSNLILNGGEVKTYKNNGSDVFGANIYYRIYSISDTTPGNFIQIPLGFNADLGNGDQRWQTSDYNVNILSGLSAGTYYLEVYWDANTSDGTKFDSNFGVNFKATFTVDITPPSISFNDPSDAAVTNECGNDFILTPPIVSDNCGSNDFALDFDGINDYVDLGTPILSATNSGQPYTVEMWVKPTSKDAISILFGQYGFGSVFDFRSFLYISSSSTGGKLTYFKGNFVTVEGTTNLFDNQWHHVAMVRENSGTLTLYVDGLAEAVSSDTYIYANTNTILGGEPLLTSEGSHYDGLMDEVRIWNTAKSQTEITNLLNSTLTGSESGLVAYYNFEDGTGSSSLTDNSANSNNGTLINMDPNTDWISSFAPITNVDLINSFTGTSDASGTYPDGETIVTWTATDAAGNETTLQQSINAGDTQAPVISFSDPGDATVSNECGNDFILTPPIVSDNCTINTALDFDGIDDFIETGNYIVPTSGDFSVQLWVYNRSISGFREFISQGASGDAFYIGTSNNSGIIRCGDKWVNTGVTLPSNQWVQITFVKSSSNALLYLNGNLAANTTNYSISNSGTPTLIGRQYGGLAEYPNATLDELRIWNRALSSSEIISSYDKILTGSEPGLVAYYSFEDGTGSYSLTDISANSNNGTLTNMDPNTDWISSSAPITNVALTNSFTGTSNASGIYPNGETIVTWTATDASGNQSTLQQAIIAGDTEAPTITCGSDITVSASSDNCEAFVEVTVPQVSDNCATGNALDFDGIDDWVTVSSTIDSFKTIEFWLYTETGIFGDEPFEYVFSWNNSNIQYIATGGFSTSYTNETISMVTNFGQIMTTFEDIPPGWNHIAFTGNGSSFDKILINGVSVPVVNNGFPQVFTASTTEIGRNTNTTAGRFSGKLDEVRFWNTARTVQEISDNFNNELTAQTGLTALYLFDQGIAGGDNSTETTLLDSSGNNFNGTLNNFTLSGCQSNWTAGFNGVTLTNDYTNSCNASGAYPFGNTVITWTATDANGNSDTCTQIITVEDNTPPPGQAQFAAPQLALNNVPEAYQYNVVYELNIPTNSDWNVNSQVPYTINNVSQLNGNPINRVAYLMQLDSKWVWVSFDAITQDYNQIGIPADYIKQQVVNNMNVVASANSGVTSGNFTTGNIEFWSNCYGTQPGNNAINGSPSTYDFNDFYTTPDCYGSFQIHNYNISQTIFGFNRWSNPIQNGPSDLGIGNNTNFQNGPHSDWTYTINAGTYNVKKLYVLTLNETNNIASPLEDVIAQCEVTSLDAPTVIDTCAGEITGTTDIELPITTQGTTVVTWTFDDGNGNVSTQTQNVIIEDTDGPQLTCNNATLYLDENGTASLGANSVNDFSGTQGLGNWTYGKFPIADPSAFEELPNFTGFVWNNPGVGAILDFPQIDANGGHPQFEGLNAAVRRWTSNMDATIFITGDFYDRDLGGGDGANVRIYQNGTQVYDYQNIPGESNKIVYNLTLSVSNGDTIDFAIDPKFDAANDDTHFTSEVTIVSAIDNCGLDKVSIETTDFSCADIGDNSIQVTATDINGNDSSCSPTITVVDDIAPVISCSDAALLTDIGECTATILDGSHDATVNDNCNYTLTNNYTNSETLSGAVFSIGSTIVIWTATDSSGNSSTCEQTIEVTSPAPVIVEISPVSVSYGEALIINGNYFTNIDNEVIMNGVIAPIISQNATSIEVTVPDGICSGNLAVTNGCGLTSNSIAYSVNPPVISSIAPSAYSTIGGETVTILGSDFAPNSTVLIGGQTGANVTYINSNEIEFTVPSGLCSGEITVTSCGNVSNAVSYSILPPAITSIDPNTVSPGDSVTIQGTNFTASGNSVTIGGQSGVIVSENNSEIVFTVPQGLCDGDIQVTSGCGLTSNSIAYSVNPPVISSIAPNAYSTIGGETVTILGSDFAPNSTVLIGGQTGANVTYINSNEIEFTVPSGLCSGEITVTSCGNMSNAVSYSILPPAITSISNTVLPVEGGLQLTITGVNFSGSDNTVTFNGVPGTNIISESFNSITVTTPAGICSGTLVVTSACGTSSSTFPYSVNPPVISGISVSPIEPGNALVISGNNFNPGENSVSINGINASITNETFNQIEVTVPDLNNACSAEVVVTTCGNQNSNMFFSPAVETVIPTFSNCPGNINLTATSAAGAVATWNAPLASDNCNINSQTYSTSPNAGLASGDTFPIGITTVTYTATDDYNNTGICSFTVEVVGVAPEIVCPNDIIVNNDPGQCGAIVNFAATETTGIPASTITYSHQPGSFFPVGTTTVTATAINAVGTSTCTFDVVVTDNEAPSISCPQDIEVFTDPGAPYATVGWEPIAASDNCAVTSLSGTHNPGDLFYLSASGTTNTTVVTYTATDAAGNNVSCSFNITVRDNESPLLDCPSDITVSNDPGACGAGVGIDIAAFDNSGFVDVSDNIPQGSFFEVGTTTVNVTAVDPTGNTSNCSFTVTVVDNEAPDIICPADITVVNDIGECGAIVDFNLSATDNCTEPPVITPQNALIISGIIDGPLTNGTPKAIEFYAAADIADLSLYGFGSANNGGGTDGQEYTFSGSVNAGDYIYIADAANGGIAAFNTYFGFGPHDTSSAAAINGDDAIELFYSGSVVDVFGDINVDGSGQPWEYTDGWAYRVNDTGPDGSTFTLGNWTFSGPNALDGESTNTGASTPFPIGSYSQSSGASGVTVTSSPESGTFFDVGTTTVTVTATDAEGNTATCSFDLTVNDTEDPTISCVGTQNKDTDPGECDYTVVGTEFDPTDFGDNCPGSTIANDYNNSSSLANAVFPAGTTTVVWTVTDATGNNTATCSFDLVVTDNEDPVVTCPSNITVSNDVGECGAVVDFAATATDNCSVFGGTAPSAPLVITGVVDGNLSGGTPKAIEFYVISDIADLSDYGFGSANNGGGSDGEEFTFPAVSATAGDYIYVASESIQFNNFFGFNPDYTSGFAAINGDDAVELFGEGVVIDTFGDINVDGSNQAWDYEDGWAYRISNTGPDGEIFTIGNWTFSGKNALDPALTNASASIPFPIGSYTNSSGGGGPAGTIAYSHEPGSIFPVGTTEVTVTTTDAEGNTATCSFDVVVTDDEDPVANCPTPAASYTADAGLCTSELSFAANPTDNCGVESTVYSVEGTTITFPYNFPVGTTTVDVLVTDIHDNTDECSFDVVVTDDEDPIANCPTPAVSYTADAELCTAELSFNTNPTDNCGVESIVYSVDGTTISFPYDFPVGTTTVDVLVTDIHDNTDQCSFDVVVTDDEDPVLTLPTVAASFTADEGVCHAALTLEATAADNCGVESIVYSVDGTEISFPYNFPVGTTTVDVLATDIHGNTASDSYDVTVTDDEDPELTLPTVADSYTADAGFCYASLTLEATATDNCDVESIVYSVDETTISFPYNFPVGTTTVDVLVTDIHGNTASDSYDVTVTDDEDPDITCPTPAASYSNDANQCSAAVSGLVLAQSDECGIASTTWTYSGDTSGNGTGTDASGTFNVGTTTVTFTVTDIHNNVSSCDFEIVVIDDEAPEITCPMPATSYSNDPDSCDAAVSLPALVYSDECGIASVTNSYNGNGADASDTYPVGTTTVTFTVTDIHNNISTCSIDIVVVDDEAPEITCPTPATSYSNDPDSCDAAVSLPALVYSDECGIASVTNSYNGNGADASDTYPVGTTTVTFTVTDIHNNISTCSIDIVVVDDEAPVITGCDNTITVNLSDPDELNVTVDELFSFDDNCGIEYTSIILSQTTPFSCEDIGGDLSDLIISEYIDGPEFENYIELFNGTGVTVDLSEYQLYVYYDGNNLIEYSLNGTIDPLTSSTGGAVVIAHADSFAAQSIANNTIGDLNFNGNDGIALAHNGIIIDRIPIDDPGISLEGTKLIRKPTVNAGNTSNSSGADEWLQSYWIDGEIPVIANYSDLFQHTIEINTTVNNVEVYVEDIHGNASTCIAYVTIFDDVDPIPHCKDDIIVHLDANGNGTLEAGDVDDESEDCSPLTFSISQSEFTCADIGEVDITLTVTDSFGNSATCDTTITVVDTVAPTVNTQNITVALDASGNASIVASDVDNDETPSSDNCDDDLTMSVTPNSFTCDDIGENTVTLTVTDNYNNTSSAAATVNIVDNLAPVVVCQDITIELINGQASITAEDIDDGSSDNCEIDFIEIDIDTFYCEDIGDNDVELTVTDVNGNSSTCTATVTVVGVIPTVTINEPEELSEFCQGAVLVLTTTATDAATYLWSTGETSESIEVDSNGGTFTVTVTSSYGCTASNTYTVAPFDASSLLSSYTILAEEEVYLHGSNLVQSGGVGVTGATGLIKLHQASTIVDFGRATNQVLNQGSLIGTPIYSPADITFPEFMFNTQSNVSSPNFTVETGQSETLNGTVYGTITVKQNATVTFTQGNVYIDDLKTFDGAAIEFSGCTNVYINDKFTLAQNGTINAGGERVVMYVNEDVQIERGSYVQAKIHSNGNELLAKGANANGSQEAEPTDMIGMFIARKVHGSINVRWKMDTNCTPCPVSAPASPIAGGNGNAYRADFDVFGWPNPSDTQFTVKLNSLDMKTKVSVYVFDMDNKLVHSGSFNPAQEYTFGRELEGGVYIVKVDQGNNTKTIRLIKY